MRILFLGNKDNNLVEWLKETGEEVIFSSDQINREYVAQINPEIIISYNYRYILRKEVFSYPAKGAVNLHISHLPFNRGADPNIWSFLKNTPKGVTIHYIDEGIDTGDIIVQKRVDFSLNKETLKTSYDKLQSEILVLFKEHWNDIKEGKLPRIKQNKEEGTVHYMKDRIKYEALIREKGWDTLVATIIARG